MWKARDWAISGSVVAALLLSVLLPLFHQVLIIMQLPSCAVQAPVGSPKHAELQVCALCRAPSPGPAHICLTRRAASVPCCAPAACTRAPTCPHPPTHAPTVTQALVELPFTAITALTMSINSIPMIAIVYLRLGDGPSFPMQRKLPKAAHRLLLLLGFRRARRPWLQTGLQYLGATSVLLGYTLTVYLSIFHGWSTSGVFRFTGLLYSGVVIWLDGSIWLYAHTHPPRPGLASRIAAPPPAPHMHVHMHMRHAHVCAACCTYVARRSCVRSGLLPFDRPVEPLAIMLGCRVGLVLTAGESNIFSFAAILFLIVGSYVGAQFVIRRSQVCAHS